MTTLSSTKDDLFNLSLIRSYVDKELNPRFVERHWLKKQVEDKLADPNCRFVLLTAEPGAGKSAFMAWLAHKNSDWCRYFIRRDQRTPLGDVGSFSFLLQVGFQLSAIYPYLFKQEQIKIVVEQRIGTAASSEIVGAEIGKMFASPFYEKVIQIQQQVTHSKDTSVTGIRIDEFYATERDLPIDNLQFMALFDPAKALLMKMQETVDHPQLQIVVLVDALDELRYQNSELSLLKWLTNCPELPANLRFVLTCRPDDDLLRAFRGNQQGRIQEISIAEEDPDVEKDLALYTRYLIETPEVNQTLNEIHQGLDAFTRQAITKANGNFGYLEAVGRAVDEAIRQNEQPLLREILKLSELPDTLQDLYAFFLGKIKDTVVKEKVPVEDAEGEIGFMPVWSAVYKPILGILSVSLEPLTPNQIQTLGLIQAEFDYVIGAIERLQQFLDQLGGCYRLYHSTLPEFFTSPQTKERKDYAYCYVDAVKQNQRIVSYYQAGKKDWAEVDLNKIVADDYGRRHLAQHLVKGDRVEELHILLNLEKNGKNAWFKVKDNEGDTAGFLADIKLAWHVEEQNWTEALLPQVMEKQCFYALILSSLNSLADIPTKLLEGLVKVGLPYGWSPEKGLAYARQIPDPAKRAKSLEALIEYFPEEKQVKIWCEVLSAAQAIQNKYSRVDALIALTTSFPKSYKEALGAARAIQHEDSRANALSRLAANLPQELYKEALNAIRAIQHESYRSQVLSALAASFPELYKEALGAARAIQDEGSRANALSRLAANLPQELYKEALGAARAIQHESYRSQVLSALAANFPKLYKEALTAALAIQDEDSRANALSRLAANFPELYKEALSAALAIQSQYNRAKALSVLAANLPQELYKEALNATRAIQDEFPRFQVLSRLATNLPQELYKEALNATRAIQDESYRADVLSGLAANLPQELCKEALNAALDIRHESYRSQVLSALAANFPELYEEALNAALAIQDEDSRANALSRLAANLPQELYKETLNAALAIQHEDSRSQVLIELAANFPELYEEALNAAQAIQDELCRTNVLRRLAANLPQELSEEDLNAALAIQNDFHRAQALIKLAPYFPEVYKEALSAAQAIRNESARANTLITLVTNLPHELYKEALIAIHDIYDEYCRADVLSALAANLPQGLYKETSITVRDIYDKYYPFGVLSALAARLPLELYKEALSTTQTIQNESSRADVLSRLAANLPQELYKEALRAALAIQDEFSRVKAVSALAAHFPEELYRQALSAVQAIQSGAERAKALNNLIPQSVTFPTSQQFIIWQEILYQGSQRKRPDFLSDLAALVPLIDNLGGKAAGIGIAKSIQQISQWWR